MYIGRDLSLKNNREKTDGFLTKYVNYDLCTCKGEFFSLWSHIHKIYIYLWKENTYAKDSDLVHYFWRWNQMSFSSHFRFSLVLADEVTKMFIYIF